MTPLEGAFPEPGLWASVWKLLRLRLVIQISGLRRATLRRKISYALLGLVGLAFMGFVLFLSIILLNFMHSAELQKYIGDVSPLLESFPTLMLSVAAIGIIFTGFGVLLQALYLSGDMDFLMSAPLPIRAVFIAKLVQAILPNFLLISLFALPLLIGLGVSGGYNLLYYPLVVVMLVLITLAAAALASLLVMAAARFIPARRLAEVLGFVVGTAMFIFSQSSRFFNYEVSNQQISAMLMWVSRFNQPWSPMAWAGQGLTALGAGNWLPALGYLAAASALTIGVFYLALTTSERLYYSGWASLQSNRRRGKKKPAEAPAISPAKAPLTAVVSTAAVASTTSTAAMASSAARPSSLFDRLIPRPVRAILAKDLRVYRRDLRNMSHLVTPLILGVVYAIGLLQGNPASVQGQGEAPAWIMSALNGIYIYGDVALALFLGWMLVANLAGPAFSLEGKSYWMLKCAPISAWRLLQAKFMTAYTPALAVTCLYTLALEILKGSTLWQTVVSLAAVILALAGVVGIYLSLGVKGAKFDWENPAQMNRSVGCLGSLIGVVYMGVTFLLFIGPAFAGSLLGLPMFIGQAVGLVIGGAVSITAVAVPLRMVVNRIPTLAE